MTTQKFTGKSVIVTGAGSSIGAAIAKRFAKENAFVILADRDLGKAREQAKEIEETGILALASHCDVANEDDVRHCVSMVMAICGRLDIIVNNAGLMTFNGLDVWTTENWQEVLGVNLMGAVNFTKQAFIHMKGGGSIINIASIHALMTSANAAPYAASKAALVSLTRTSSIEGQRKGIRANAILPGAIDTPMLWNNPMLSAEQIDPSEIGTPEDIAAAAVFLSSDDASFISGTTLVVDGGRLARL